MQIQAKLVIFLSVLIVSLNSATLYVGDFSLKRVSQESTYSTTQTYKTTEKIVKDETKPLKKEQLKDEKTTRNVKVVASRSGWNVSRSERDLLERIVMAEAGGEPYEGQVAVANVILNRVKAGFGKNIREVIFQKGQFTPAMNGTIYKVVPTKSVKKAVADALSGKKVVGDDVLYFVNPKIATDMTIPKTKKFVVKIGNHCFYK